MIVRCIHNTGSALGKPPPRGDWYSDRTVYQLELGQQYVVVGLGIFDTALLVLVRDETGNPSWDPIGLFEVDDPVIPAGWEFAAASGGDTFNRWVARWGYPELVHDERHVEALIELDPRALEIFANELRRRDPHADL